MNQKQFLTTMTWLSTKPLLKKLIIAFAEHTSLLLAVLYTLFIFYVGLFAPYFLMKALCIPALALGINTLLRHYIQRPRPFEVYHFEPLYPHAPGHSFPSRHATSSLVIGLTIFFFQPTLGLIVIGMALVMGLCRVLLGIHYPSDIIGGFAIASLCALLLWI